MLIKTGIAVSDMSGSSGGITAGRNRFGLYLRSRTTPVNPNTDRQTQARSIMAFLAEYWREAPMDDAKRLSWATYAASFNWNNRLGEAVNLTGFNAFCMCGAAKIHAGGSHEADGPAALGLPAQDPAFQVTISAAAQKLAITFNDGFDWCDEDFGFLLVQMHQPQSPSRNFFGGPYRTAGSIPGSVAAPAASPDATIDVPYTAVEGQKTVCRARVIRADSRCSTHFYSDQLIIAA